MNIKILLDAGMMERRDLRSGRIYREGEEPEYGVIFTSHINKTEDDLGLNPNVLAGTFIGKKDIDESEKEQFFKILGGYFYHDNYPDVGIVTQVFGIALDPKFGIEEGGSKTLDDNWKLQDPEKPILNESYWSNRYGPHHGWTFIVTLKEREKFPTSENRLKIFALCPEIHHFSATIGECQVDPQDNSLKRNVVFQTQADAGVKNWTFNFGDGTTLSGDSAPPEKINHLYKEKPGSPVTVCVQGQTACDEFCAEADLDDFQVCPKCPEIARIDVIFGECKKEGGMRKRRITFAAQIEGDAPVRWLWEFGDGLSDSGEGKPPATIEHYYSKTPDSTPKLCLTGPEPCKETCVEVNLSAFQECEPCPKITKIEHVIRDKDRESKIAEFQVSIEGRRPQKFEWDWGDGSAPETTIAASATHEYAMLASGPPNYIVTLKANGPEDCSTTAQTSVRIPGKVICPVIKGIKTEIGKCVTEGTIRKRKVTFIPTAEGDTPDRWTMEFGDGSSESGEGMPPGTIEHFFEKKPEHAPKLCLFGPKPCAESCMQVDISEFPQCQPCPKIIDIQTKIVEKSQESERILFTTAFEGRQPQQFVWQWGDGSPDEITSSPNLAHSFRIPAEGSNEYTVSVTSQGPEDCADSMDTKVQNVARPKVSSLCTLLPYLIGFLSALTLGTFILRLAGEFFPAIQNDEWISIPLIIFVLLTFFTLVFWYRVRGKANCPKPYTCNWLAIGWVALLSSAIDAAYILNCCKAWWWIVIILFLVLAAILFFRWLGKCNIKITRFLIHVLASLLASIVIYFLIVQRLIQNCLH